MINYINCEMAVIGLVYFCYPNPASTSAFNTFSVSIPRFYSPG